jgi:hypothetical protein
MTIYATGNAVGSTNPKDLLDNAQNIDYWVLGPLLSYPDRLGANRPSWAGIEASFAAAQTQRTSDFNAAQDQRAADFSAAQAQRASDYAASEASRGYETPVPYVAGIALTRVTQLVQYNSELYKAKAGTLPWTTTGVWATDSAKLVSVGDAALRQNLADPSIGASIVVVKQVGTGAATRTAKDKLNEFPSLADYGGVADWNGTTGADNKAALDKLFAAHDACYVLPGRWRCNSSVDVPAGKKVIFLGGGELVFTTGSLRMAANTLADHAFVSGNGKTNAASGFSILAGADNVTLNYPKVRSVYNNGVDNGSGADNLKILKPDFDDIGGTGINPTFQGMGVYSQGGDDLLVEGGEIQRTYGEAAVFINGGANPSVCRVYIHDTFYRGIELFGSPTNALLGWNIIRRTGAINTTTSGVGCNGIYSIVASQRDAWIVGNDIEDVAENGIEGNGTIEHNKVNRTGYRNLTTPSKEGIFLNTRAACRFNTVSNAQGDGIKAFSSVSGQENDIAWNTINNPVGAGVTVQVDGAGVVFGKLNVVGTTVYGANDPSKLGLNIFRSNGAVFDLNNSSVTDNTVFGRANNAISSFIGVVGRNSFDPTLEYFGDVTGTASKAKSFTMIFNAPITVARAALANTANPAKGDILRVVRAATATGAFSINVQGSAGTIKALSAAGQWADFAYDGATWALAAFGSL